MSNMSKRSLVKLLTSTKGQHHGYFGYHIINPANTIKYSSTKMMNDKLKNQQTLLALLEEQHDFTDKSAIN